MNKLSFTVVSFVILLVAGCYAEEQAEVVLLDVEVPASTEYPEGMLEIESEADDYVAIYLPDIEYASPGGRALKMQILMPEDRGGEPATDAPAYPLIVFVQGSAWLPQGVYAAIPQLSDFAHQGYVVASVAYRPSTEAKAPAQVQDVKTAIRFLRENAERFNIDPSRIGIWGDSSGGHMASMVGTSDGVDDFLTDDYIGHSSAVQAVVNFYGPTDFRKMNSFPTRIDHDAPDSPESMVIGGPIQDPVFADKVAAYNPITYISPEKTLPPFLILHGDQDGLVPFNQSVLLFESLRDAGQEVTFYKVKGAGHGNRFWTPGVLEIVHTFFDRQLKGELTIER